MIPNFIGFSAMNFDKLKKSSEFLNGVGKVVSTNSDTGVQRRYIRTDHEQWFVYFTFPEGDPRQCCPYCGAVEEDHTDCNESFHWTETYNIMTNLIYDALRIKNPGFSNGDDTWKLTGVYRSVPMDVDNIEKHVEDVIENNGIHLIAEEDTDNA